MSIALLMFLTTVACVAAPPAAPTEDSWWYYEIGGAEPISPTPNPELIPIELWGQVELSAGYSCGKFDPVAAISNSLNEIGQGVEDIGNAMVQAATGAIASLPMLILQRANPGLYDLFQNALLRAEEKLELAAKTCEQMEAEIAAGKNPYADLITLSKGNDWKVQMGIGGNDAVSAKEAVEESNGANGVPWVKGRAGGEGQPPIEMTGDVVRAGYNLLLNRPISSAAPAPSTGSSRLVDLWPAPNDAADWVRQVIGENRATTCEYCAKTTSPGTGLLPKLEGERSFVSGRIQALVNAESPLTLRNLDDVAAPGVAITRQVIESIREMPEADQPLIIDRLIAEVSTARTIEKALLARRVLITGKQVPEIYAVQLVQTHVDQAVQELDREVENLLFETRVRREIVSDTISVLLQRAAIRRQSSLGLPETPLIDPNPIKNGRVEPD